MKKQHREYISREKLIQSFPVDKTFTFEMLKLDILKGLFYQRVKELQPQLQIIGKGNERKYRISQEDKNTLLRADVNIIKKGKTVNAKVKPHKLTKMDILHNLFEGMTISKEQRKLI